MNFLSRASNESMWRGYEYWKGKKVLFHEMISDHEFIGKVKGNREYNEKINVEHPKQSECDCPFAHGRKVICKHMVALYFALYPREADAYYQEVMQAEDELEKEQEETEKRLVEFVSKMDNDELKNALLQVLFDGPDWQYDKFVREYLE